MRTIEEVTGEFGQAYAEAKTHGADKDKLQKEFFALATELLDQGSKSTRTITVPYKVTGKEILQQNPGWRIVDSHTMGEDHVYLIEEDPALMSFTYINPNDHMVYARTTAQGSPMLDDERLRDEDPQLWEEISSYPDPWYSLVEGAIKEAQIWFDQAGEFDSKVDIIAKDLATNFLQAQGVQRVLRPIDELTDDQLASLQSYLVPSPITVRLVAPRKAKQEELEEAGLA